MLIYFLIWFICVVVMLIPSQGRGYNIKLLICFTLLFLFGAFRYDFGLDYSGYENNYNSINQLTDFYQDNSERLEIGYRYLNYVSPSFRFVIIISTALICFAYFKLFQWYVPSKYGALAMALFYLCGNDTVFFMFSGMRNGIAVAILILTLPLIEQKRIVYFAVAMFMAGLIHQSAFIVFPIAYLIGYIKEITPKVSKWMIIAAVTLWLTPFDLLLSLSSRFISANFDRYTYYIEQAESIGRGASMLVSLSNVIMIALVCLGLDKLDLGKRITTVVVVGLISCYASLLGPLNMRISIYFATILIIAVIYAFDKIKKPLMKIGLMGLFVAYHAYDFFVVWMGNPRFAYSDIHNYFFDIF